MSSDSELSPSSESSSNDDDIDVSEEEEDIEVVYSQYRPYQDEPLAEDDEEDEDEDEEVDVDGLSPAVLESRYERTVAVNSWFV